MPHFPTSPTTEDSVDVLESPAHQYAERPHDLQKPQPHKVDSDFFNAFEDDFDEGDMKTDA